MNYDNALIEKAREYWFAHSLDNYDYILLLPDEDESLNLQIREEYETRLGHAIGTVIEGYNARLLTMLYSLYAFTDKLIIGSFDLPHGRKLRNLLESGVATEAELISEVILGTINGSKT